MERKEVVAAVDVLLNDQLIMGREVAASESEWSAMFSSSFATMVNFCSSANLLTLRGLAFVGGTMWSTRWCHLFDSSRVK